MSDWLERVHTELSDLNAKMTKLRDALGGELRHKIPSCQIDLMNVQLSCMVGYAQILELRIKAHADGE